MANMPRPPKWLSRHFKLASLLSAAYTAIILLGIVAFGSARPFALSTACCAISILLILAVCLRGIPSRSTSPVIVASSYLCIAIAWILIQAGLLNFGIPGSSGTISVQPSDSIFAVQFLAYPVLIYLTGVVVLQTETDAREFNVMLTLGCSALVMVSFVQFLLSPGYVLTVEKQAYIDSFTATLINRNSAGTLVGLTIILVVRQLWSACRDFRSRDIFAGVLFMPKSTDRSMTKIYFYMILFCALTVALFLTKSRGAIASTIFAALLLASLLVWLRLKRRYAGVKLARHIAGSLVVIAVLSVGATVLIGERVVFRATAIGSSEPRMCALPGMFRALDANMILGSGAGTFKDVFAPYRDPRCGLQGIWEKAHNTYLQSWIELGVMGPVLIVATIGWISFLLISSLKAAPRQRSYVAMGISSLALVAIHAFVDFSLEIPGISGLFAAIIAISTSIAKKNLQCGRNDGSDFVAT